MSITTERVREALHYDPETGVFTWLIRPSIGVQVGDVAGGLTNGYWKIRLDRRPYGAHQLAWLYVHGVWPTHEIDHINGVRDDNRWVNLRDGSNGVNQRNVVTPRKDSLTGLRGVTRNGSGWRARLRVDGRDLSLGTFATPEEAQAAYWVAKAAHHAAETYQARFDREVG